MYYPVSSPATIQTRIKISWVVTSNFPVPMNNRQEVSEVEKSYPLREKWGDSLRQGFVVIPWVMLSRQRELGLTSLELVVLMHLIASWWEANNAPYPSSHTIAKRMAVSARTVQRHLKSLEGKGFLVKLSSSLANNGTNLVTRYNLTPLAQKLSACVINQVKRAREAVPMPTENTV